MKPPPAYYNENDPEAAAWLRELIKRNLIAPGDVDERSIEDVRPEDLNGYTQVHLYAGIGVWSYALRRAGWRDDERVWTFSEPCQPFSAAGKGLKTADKRYLRPATHHLVSQCRPDVCFAEQVASKDGLTWLDTVQADMEGEGYTGGFTDLCAPGFGAPHIRQRLYGVFVLADTERQQHEDRLSRRHKGYSTQGSGAAVEPTGFRVPSGLADAERSGLEGRGGTECGEQQTHRQVDALCAGRRVADTSRGGRIEKLPNSARCVERDEPRQIILHPGGGDISRMADASGNRCSEGRQRIAAAGRDGFVGNCGVPSGQPAGSPVNGFWGNVDWLFCRDGKWRPVEPGTFPLAHGPAARVVRLRGYGNAINAEQATSFVEAFIDAGWERFGLDLI